MPRWNWEYTGYYGKKGYEKIYINTSMHKLAKDMGLSRTTVKLCLDANGDYRSNQRVPVRVTRREVTDVDQRARIKK